MQNLRSKKKPNNRPQVYNLQVRKSKWVFVCFAGISLGVFLFLISIFLLTGIKGARAEEVWKVTGYCSCFRCCGKSDGVTASGKKAKYGHIALNWLPFGTKVKVDGLGVFSVQDRGAKSLFGTIKNPIKHIDIYFPSHAQALKFGVQYRKVEIIK